MRTPARSVGRILLTAAVVGTFSATAARAQPELVDAFIFGSRNLACPVGNQPDRDYTVVFHGTPTDLQYDAARGWGYEVLFPGDASRAGFGIFGPFDDSANNRTAFPDSCPSQIYDSFIGAKNFLNQCDEFVVGSREDPCEIAIAPEGIIFRVDVPNGRYRFVAAVGSADNPHASRILVENGGDGTAEFIGDDHVVLVNNFDQAQHCAGTFARVGFGCFLPPEGEGPGFVNMDEEGFDTEAAPSSPVLEVTEGYLRVHQLQGNSNAGDCAGRDPNGGNMVLLELWRVDDGGEDVDGVIVDVSRAFAPDPFSPGDEVEVTLSVSGATVPTTIVETIPEGWEIVDVGGAPVAGREVTFEVEGDGDVTYAVRSPRARCGDVTFSAAVQPNAPGGCPTVLESGPVCEPVGCGLRASGGPSNLLIIGPIDLVAQAGANCDDNGNLGNVSYLADGDQDETTILLSEGDEIAPDFGGESAGNGVDLAVNPDVNPDGAAGILQVWRAQTDADGYVDFNAPENIGDPVDDYIVYALTYLRNTTANCVDATIEVGSDDAAVLYVNGQIVHVNRVCRGVPGAGGGDMVPVKLAPGVNVVLAGVVERGGGTGVRLLVRRPDGTPYTDGTIEGLCEAPAAYPTVGRIERTLSSDDAEPGDEIQVTLTGSNLGLGATVAETVPAELEIADAGGGAVEGNVITFDLQDGDTTYTLRYPEGECAFVAASISGEITDSLGCATIAPASTITCTAPPCEAGPDASAAELYEAFLFSANLLDCEVPNDPDFFYNVVHHSSPEEVTYTEDRGWGYEVIYPDPLNQPYGARNGYGIFGPFDDSPNARGNFTGAGCPEEIYDSFIGAKDFATACNEMIVDPVDPNASCDENPLDPRPEGLIFRVDVPNGTYRFVAAMGDADNPHAHRLVIEDGGEGPPEDIGDNHVVLVHNFDQTQETLGEAVGGCTGCSVFAAVGFDDKLPPSGDGVAPDPKFVNMDVDGLPTAACPESPVLRVTQGYIRVHQLQGNSNAGPGRATPDPNGGDLVLLEVWEVEDDGGGPQLVRGDADASGAINITDGIFVLNFLFLGGPAPGCQDGADADDSGALNITDGIFVLNFLFLGGTAPPAPYPACGEDPTDDALPCDASQATCN